MNTTVSKHKIGLTTFDIKILGIVLMFIDHVHQMFAPMGAPGWLDWFGRPVATIFFFISAEGFAHTHDRKKYLSRLLLGFWIMNLGDFFISKFFSYGSFALSNNIFTDLFIAVLTMYGIELIKSGKREKKAGHIVLGSLLILLPILASGLVLVGFSIGGSAAAILSMIIPNVFMAENSIYLYLAVVFYLLRGNRKLQCAALALVALSFMLRDINGLFTTNTQWMMIFAMIPMLMYNGEKGRSMRSFFYGFYPAHIWLLYVIASFIYTQFH